MMIAPTIKKLIQKYSKYLDVDKDFVYCYTIDPTVRSTSIGQNTILVTEISDDVDAYGSDYSISREGRCQVQLFFTPSYAGDTSRVRDNLEVIMRQNNWFLFRDTGISRDPSVEALYCTMQFRSNYEKNINIQ